MSTARHHAEWLSLIEVSGPFLSMPVLLRVFPQGLGAHSPALFQTLKLGYEEWQDNNEAGARTNPALHPAWIKFVLTNILGLPAESLLEFQAIPQSLAVTPPGEHAETIRPNLVLTDPATTKPRLLIQTYPPNQDLDKPVAGKTWKASPGTRMMELLHAGGVRLGLVTNGERWMLVDAPKSETTGFASWYANLWIEERITLQAFVSLLGAERFFAVVEEDTLEKLLLESAGNQQEVTDQLGYQVRNAVEVLVQAIDRINQDRKGQLLEGVPEKLLYEAALTYMMRLVFLFCAEERRLFPLDNELYAQHYAASTLREQLRRTADDHGEEILERRHDAWSRLLSTFRMVFGGCEHPELRMPAYAGHLFDPDRFTFLEGRKATTSWRNCEADPLPVNNRTVLHLLEALQLLQVKVPGGGERQARRLSFRALDIEQIGHVYEGLLDHTAKRATEPMLGLTGGRDSECEVPLQTLESLLAQGETKLVEFLNERTGRSVSAISKALALKLDLHDAGRFRSSCGNDEKLVERIEPFAGFIRRDTYDYPVIVRTGSIFVTAGTDRRSSGTHYTPRSLTEPIVQYTLEPLIYVGPAEGKPTNQWQLRSAKELLDLKICDMACGSGAFLVQGCRYMSDRLLEAWEIAEAQMPAGTPGITPEGTASKGLPGETLLSSDPDERRAFARRIVAQRCLYGVDINPLAAEMAKLSLWLLTLAKDKPFTFLDHSIRCGDSLLGIHDLKQLKTFSLDGGGQQYVLGEEPLDDLVEKAIELRLNIESFPSDSVQDIKAQEHLMLESERRVDFLMCAADLLVSAELKGGNPREKQENRNDAAVQIGYFSKSGDKDKGRAAARMALGRRSFHWPLEFPEIVVRRGGFDAFVGNPPFMGGRIIGRVLSGGYHDYLGLIRNQIPGSPDLCAYFLLRAYSLVKQGVGSFGLLATKSISETGSRTVCLDQLLALGGTVYRADSRRLWPGTASVVVSVVHMSSMAWSGSIILDDRPVSSINGGLEEAFVSQQPYRLLKLQGRYSQGQDIMGEGFELTSSERESLLIAEPKSKEVIFPLFNGQDLNNLPSLRPYRWVIYFRDWPESKAREYPQAFSRVERLVKPYRDGLTGQIHQSCFWKFWDLRPRLISELERNSFVLVAPINTKFVSFRRVPTSSVYNKKVKLFFLYDWASFAMLQSTFHQEWAFWRCGTLGATTLNYSTSAALETWPIPSASTRQMEQIGKQFHEYRGECVLERNEGFTQIYNRFHDPDETGKDIKHLRSLQVEMDLAVLAAYGWDGILLGYDFHETKQGIRYTISESARREVLARLLNLNHERYAEEVGKGLHAKGNGKDKGKSNRLKHSKNDNQPDLFGKNNESEDRGDEVFTESVKTVTESEDMDINGRERPSAIDDVDTDHAMAAFRQASRGLGWIRRDDLLKAVSERLGYERLSSKVRERLKGHLRSALRRKVLEANGDMVKIATPTMSAYWDQYRDELIDLLCGVMRAGQRYERDEVIYALAARLGFERVKETVEEPIRSAMNGAIRREMIRSDGNLIWRT